MPEEYTLVWVMAASEWWGATLMGHCGQTFAILKMGERSANINKVGEQDYLPPRKISSGT
jgi:hypothetical protein